MKLFYSPGACSLASHIVAKALDLPVTLVKVNLAEKKTSEGEDFLSINKKGYIPVLGLDDGSFLTEGVAILQYLADLKPDAKLAPANGTLERYRLQEWLAYINSEIHKSHSPFFQPETPELTINRARDTLVKRYGFVADHLANHQFLLGESFTVADAYLFTVLGWAGYVGVDLSQWPAVVAYQQRIAQLPFVKAAQAAEAA